MRGMEATRWKEVSSGGEDDGAVVSVVVVDMMEEGKKETLPDNNQTLAF